MMVSMGLAPDVLLEVVPFTAMPIPHGAGVGLHLPTELVDVVVEPFPGSLPAHPYRPSDRLPGRPGGHRFGSELRLPGRQKPDKGTCGS